MTAPVTARAGGCRCDRLRVEVTAAPMLSSICHCRGCQKMTASAYSATITVPANGIRVISGEGVLGGVRSDQAHHFHCDHCKSWVYTEPLGMGPFVNVRLTILDEPDAFPPFAEFQTAEALPWALIGAAHQFARFPEIEDFSRLMPAYIDWSAGQRS